MKSYFAKLADRATLANVPAPSPVHAPRVADPFVEAPPEPAQLPTPAVNQERLTVREPDSFTLSPPEMKQTVESQVPVVETHQHEPAEMPTEISTLQPRPAERVPSHKFEENEQEPIEASAEQAREEINRSEVREVVTLLPVKATETQTTTAGGPVAEEEPEPAEPKAPIDSQREQVMLLRKADLFMSSLFDSQREPAPEETKITEPAAPSLKKLEREPANRLEPAPKNSPVPVQESTGPSLVIGKLTVEVTPPSPPPVAPQPQRVIVRGSRGFGRGVMSNRRFGLGQF
jgi:hypothetical protein